MADTPDPAAVETVMRVQREHWFAPAHAGGYLCKCGERFGLGATAAEHVAREVVAALDLDTRAAEKRGAVNALRDAASDLSRLADHGADDEASPYESADWLRARADLRVEAD